MASCKVCGSMTRETQLNCPTCSGWAKRLYDLKRPLPQGGGLWSYDTDHNIRYYPDREVVIEDHDFVAD